MEKRSLDYFLTDAFSGNRQITSADLREFSASVMASRSVYAINDSQVLDKNFDFVILNFTNEANWVALPISDASQDEVPNQRKQFTLYNPTSHKYVLQKDATAINDKVVINGVPLDSYEIHEHSVVDVLCYGSEWIVHRYETLQEDPSAMEAIQAALDAVLAELAIINQVLLTKADQYDLDVLEGIVAQNQVDADSRLGHLETRASIVEGRLDSHDTHLSSLDGSVSSLDGRLDAVESDVSALESDVSGLDSRIDALESSGTSAVHSVNNIAPVAGNVSLTADNIPESPTRVFLTPTQESKLDSIDMASHFLSGASKNGIATLLFSQKHLDGTTATSISIEILPPSAVAGGLYFNGTTLEWRTAIPASEITQSASYRFVTDTEKATWNAKLDASAIANYYTKIQSDARYLQSYTETDPVFAAWKLATWDALGISGSDVTNWDTAYGWGNHASAGYLTASALTNYYTKTQSDLRYLQSYTETDPVFSASAAYGITATDKSNWSTAFGWGNHASAGYLTSYTETDPTVGSHIKAITATQISHWESAYGWGNHAGLYSLLGHTHTGDYAPLVGGLIPSSYLPAISITDTFVVATEAEMLALTAQTGDIAIRTDLTKTFILKGATASTLADWQELPSIGGVTSVNSKVGVVVLNLDDIADGATRFAMSSTQSTKLTNLSSYVESLASQVSGTAPDGRYQTFSLKNPSTGASANYYNPILPTSGEGFLKWNGSAVSWSRTTSYLDYDTTLYTNGVSPSYQAGRVWWNNESYNLNMYTEFSDVTLQFGEEIHIRAKNTTGSIIPNGSVVYISGAQGNKIIVGLAQSDVAHDLSVDTTIGMATHDIGINVVGRVTAFGNVGSLDTSAWVEGTALYLSPSVAGGLTSTIPTGSDLVKYVGHVLYQHNNHGIIFVCTWRGQDHLDHLHDVFGGIKIANDTLAWDGSYWRFVTQEKYVLEGFGKFIGDNTGFSGDNSAIVTTYNADRTVTISGTNKLYYEGRLILDLSLGAHTSVAHPDEVGTHYYYHNGTDFVWTKNASWAFSNAQIFFALQTAVGGQKFGVRETHGLMGWREHELIHLMLGTYKVSGGLPTIGSYVIGSTTAENRRPLIDTSLLKDEDLSSILAATSTASFTRGYLTGSGVFTFTTGNADIVELATNQPRINTFSTTWGWTSMSSNRWMNVYVLSIPTTADANSQLFRYVLVNGQAQYNSLALAQAESFTAMNFGDLSLKVSEFCITAKITIQYTAGNWNIASVQSVSGSKAQIVQTNGSQSESDPLFTTWETDVWTPLGITGTKVTNWDTAYGWGNHASAGYLTSFTETDPVFSTWKSTTWDTLGITGTDVTNWDTAYGWGNHASAGYLTSASLSAYYTSSQVDTLLNAKLTTTSLASQWRSDFSIPSGANFTYEGFKRILKVTAATTANMASLSGLSDVDGAAITTGNLILVKAQSTASENGVYVADASTWTRYSGYQTIDDVVNLEIQVLTGTAGLNTTWEAVTPTSGAFTLGATSITFDRVQVYATTAIKGIASFSSTYFSVSSGAVSLANNSTTSGISPTNMRSGVADALVSAWALPIVSATTTQWTNIGANTSATKKMLSMTGTGAAGALPVWDVVKWGELYKSNGTSLVGAGATGNFLTTDGTDVSWATSIPWSMLSGVPTLYSTFASLTDVTISGTPTGKYVRYNGTKWVDATLSLGDVSGFSGAASDVDSQTDDYFAARHWLDTASGTKPSVVGAANQGVLLQAKYLTDHSFQLANDEDDGSVYSRWFNGTTWSTWSRFATSTDLGDYLKRDGSLQATDRMYLTYGINVGSATVAGSNRFLNTISRTSSADVNTAMVLLGSVNILSESGSASYAVRVPWLMLLTSNTIKHSSGELRLSIRRGGGTTGVPSTYDIELEGFNNELFASDSTDLPTFYYELADNDVDTHYDTINVWCRFDANTVATRYLVYGVESEIYQGSSQTVTPTWYVSATTTRRAYNVATDVLLPWTRQTSLSGLNILSSLSVVGGATIGSSSSDILTINAASTFNYITYVTLPDSLSTETPLEISSLGTGGITLRRRSSIAGSDIGRINYTAYENGLTTNKTFARTHADLVSNAVGAYEGAWGVDVASNGVLVNDAFSVTPLGIKAVNLTGTGSRLLLGNNTGLVTPLAFGSALHVLRMNAAGDAVEFAAATGGMSNPMTTQGDLIVGGASGTPERLAKGNASQVLTMNVGATAPVWADATGGSGGSGSSLTSAVFGRQGVLSAAALLNLSSLIVGGSAAVGLYVPVASTLRKINITNSVSNTSASGMTIEVKYATPPLQHAFPYDALSGTIATWSGAVSVNTYGNGYSSSPNASIPAGVIVYVDLTAISGGSVADLQVQLVIDSGSETSEWIVKTANYTAVKYDKILVNTTSGAFTITLPSSPTVGTSVKIGNGGGWDVYPPIIARNGSTIMGLSEDLTIDTEAAGFTLVYDGSTWRIVQ